MGAWYQHSTTGRVILNTAALSLPDSTKSTLLCSNFFHSIVFQEECWLNVMPKWETMQLLGGTAHYELTHPNLYCLQNHSTACGSEIVNAFSTIFQLYHGDQLNECVFPSFQAPVLHTTFFQSVCSVQWWKTNDICYNKPTFINHLKERMVGPRFDLTTQWSIFPAITADIKNKSLKQCINYMK